MKTENEIKEILRKKIKQLSKLRNLKGKDFLRGVDEIEFLKREVGLLEEILFGSLKERIEYTHKKLRDLVRN